jgi:hypothetical protein
MHSGHLSMLRAERRSPRAAADDAAADHTFALYLLVRGEELDRDFTLGLFAVLAILRVF